MLQNCLPALCALCSCQVDDRYNLENIQNTDLTVTLFQKGIELPVGSTDCLTLGQLAAMAGNDLSDLLQESEDGRLGFEYADSADMSGELKKLGLDKFSSFGGVSFQKDFTYDIGLDASRLKVAGSTRNASLDLEFPDVSLPKPAEVTGRNEYTITLPDLSRMPATVYIPLETSETYTYTCDCAIDPIKLPQEISGVSSIAFDSAYKATVTLDCEELSGLTGIDVKVDSLVVEFPGEFVIEGSAVMEGSLPLKGEIIIRKMAPQSPISSTQGYEGEMKVRAKISAKGIITKDSYTSNELHLVSEFRWQPVISDYEVNVNRVEQAVAASQSFSADVSGLGDLGSCTIIPSGKPSISIGITKPETENLKLRTGNDGLSIVLPSCMQVTAATDIYPPAYFDGKTNTIRYDGEVPDKVSIPLNELVIDTEKGSFGGEIAVLGSVVSEATTLDKKDVDALRNAKIGIAVSVPDIAAEDVKLEGDLSIKVDEKETMTIFRPSDLPAELLELSEVSLKDTYLNLGVQVSGLPDVGSKGYEIDLVATLPDCISPSTISLKGKLDRNGKFSAEPVKVSSIKDIKLDGSDITGQIQVAGTITASTPDIDVNTISKSVKAVVKANIADSKGRISIDAISGRCNYGMETTKSISLDGIPDILKDESTCLDLQNPQLNLSFTGNLGVPVDGEIELIPWKDGAVAGNSLRIENISLPYTSDAGKNARTEYKVEGEKLAAVLRHLPDSIQFVVTAHTNTEKAFTLQPDADYRLSVDYDLVLPMELGEDFSISYGTTMDFSRDISQVMNQSAIGLRCAVNNTIPLGLDLELEFLDADGNVLRISEEEIHLDIPGKAESEEKVVVKPVQGAAVDAIASIGLKFVLKSAAAGGVLSADDYVQADISAFLPEGFTFNLGGQK